MAAEMSYCGPQGIRWSHFQTWPKRDRDLAILWQLRRDQTHRCGTHPDDWNPADGGHPNAFVAVERWCPGCARLEQAQLDQQKRHDNPGPGFSWVLRPPKPTPKDDAQ